MKTLFVFNKRSSLVGNLNLAIIQQLESHLGRVTVDGATKRYSGSNDFLDGALEGLCLAAWPHSTSDIDDVLHGDVTVVLDY